MTIAFIKFGKPSEIDNGQGVYGENTPHTETFGAIETKYKYWNLRNEMVANGRLEQEERKKIIF